MFHNFEFFSAVSHFKRRATLIVKVALHLRLLTTKKFRSYETVKGGFISSKNEFKIQKTVSSGGSLLI